MHVVALHVSREQTHAHQSMSTHLQVLKLLSASWCKQPFTMLVIQVPGGWAAHRWGGRRMLMVSFGLWSTASMLTPGSAASNSAIILARVAVGVAQGFLIPSVHTVLSQV